VISVDEALEKVLERIDTLGAEESDVLGCLGQVLAEDVSSPINIPPRDNSAMDGYAVRAADTRGASQKSPRFLRVVETVTAGATPQRELKAGEASRIMTGAPMPEGADSVVKFEDTDEAKRQSSSSKEMGEIGILVEVGPGAEVRRAGEDISAGSVVLRKGTVIRAAEVGVLASLGRSRVMVIRRPVVAILATGDEIADVTQPLPEGKIYNSNSYSLAALVRRYGGIPQMLGIASDSEDSLRAKLRLGQEADLVITSGGVSLGDYDVVREVLAKEGEIVFWRVREKPGKPLAFAMVRDRGGRNIPLFALAGNPVSAMINFELFVRPAILKMMGKKSLNKPTVEAVVEDDIKNSDGRRVFTRAIVEKRGGQYFARLTGPQGSGMLSSMALANGLVIVPEDKPGVKRGDVVKVMMLDWGEEIDI
jgi:molybdopterin molybdotransferase